jgi:integrase
MFGGCERGVVVALHWEDVDWVNGAINICRSWSPEEHQLSGDGLKDTKNRFRVRTIPMSQAMRESLTAVWERDGRPASGYVLRHTSRNSGRSGLYWAIGETYLPGVLLKAGFVENGKPKWTFHDLRHYAGSIWLEAGAAIHDVSRMLGHANTAITEKVYIHYFKKQQAERHREIADRVSALHRLPGGVPALPSPMREKCVIDADDAEIVE